TQLSSAGHTAVKTLNCMDCHERNYKWFGVSSLPTRPSAHTTVVARAAPNDCDNSGCHTYAKGFRGLIKPIIRDAAVNPLLGSLLPNLQLQQAGRAGLAAGYDHLGVEAGRCKTCHDGVRASGMPARHLMVSNSCDTCHRTSTWKPAYFNHSGITPNTCLACHNGLGAPGKSSGHFMTARSCDSCHKNVGWLPVNYSHLSPAYKPLAAASTCASCHVTNSEIIPRQMRSSDRPKPLPVGP
ncbi:MAG: cytochrome c3 family protein, partial [Rhodoferax sp.]